MRGAVQDLKYGVRQLRRSPGLAAVAILMLALGIGATTAIFGVVNGWLFKPLPVPQPRQITVITGEQPGAFNTQFSTPEFQDYNGQPGPFASLFGYAPDVVGLTHQRHTDPILVSYVTGNYFSSLGLKPYLGRLILPSEGQTPGADPVVVLGYDYWKSRFNGDRGAIGESAQVDGQPVTIVGVTPPGFHGTATFLDMKAYLPVSMIVRTTDFTTAQWTNRNSRFLSLMGRLKPGASVGEAQAAMNVEASGLARQYPDTERGITIYVYPEWLARPPEPRQLMRQGLIAALFLLLGGLVLLVACFNVAGMLIARALARRREMAVRVSLGATRARLLRQMLGETLVLALAGGGAGLVLGQWLARLLNLVHTQGTLTVRLDAQFDWRVYLFAFLVCLLVAVVVGLAPAFRAARANPNQELREGGSRLSAGIRSGRLRRALVATQLGGSLVLLIVSGLFVRSLGKAETANLGFDPRGVTDFTTDPAYIGYNQAQTTEFYKRLLDRVRATPGVESATLDTGAPLSGFGSAANVYAEGRVLGPKDHAPQNFYVSVTPGFFRTLRIPLARGRTFTEADGEKAPPVAVINQAMAKQLWPGEDPVGKRFRTSPSGPWISVAGVANDAGYVFVGLPHFPLFYLPVAQHYEPLRMLEVRSQVAQGSLESEIQDEIHALDPQMPVFDVQPLASVVDGPNGLMLFRIGAVVAGGLGLVGLLLAAAGLYAVISFAVSQRRNEIAIRMALGATQRNVLAGVLRDGGRMVAIGWAIGIPLALLAAYAASGILTGVGYFDLVTYALASLALALVAVVACYLPARRAMRIDPAQALRQE